MRRLRFHFAFALCCGVLVTLSFWLLQSHASPIHLSETQTVAVALPHFLNMVPTILSFVLSGHVYDHMGTREIIYFVLVFGQWFIVGLGLSFLYSGLRRH